MTSEGKSEKLFEAHDGCRRSIANNPDVVTVVDLEDADEAVALLSNHPRAAEIAAQGTAILENPIELRKLVRKIDLTIAPLLAAVYFLQFLDKTTAIVRGCHGYPDGYKPCWAGLFQSVDVVLCR
jgi:hypothetical protein